MARVIHEIRNVSRYGFRKANSHLHGLIKQMDLRHLKTIKIQFDPFHENVKSARDFHFYVTGPKLRQTGSYGVKVDVKSDRSEPTVEVKYNDGQNVLFKTKNLNTYEIFLQLRKIYEEKELAS